MLNWGMNRADERGLEVFLDSTLPGRPLYEANDFLDLGRNVILPQTEDPEDQWKKLDEDVGTVIFWPMRRPCRQKNKPREVIEL